jgi:DNA repair protein RadA/Sms
VFVNVAGGMTVDEPAADLGIIAAIASSVRNRPVKKGTAVFGEVGLAGEIRSTTQANLRVREAAQMGFTRCILPASQAAAQMGAADELPSGFELIGVKTVGDALDTLFE